MTFVSPSQGLLALVLVLRLLEFWLSRLNAERRLAAGGVEHGFESHRLLAFFHAIWLAMLTIQTEADAPVDGVWLMAAFALLALRALRLFRARRHWTWRLFAEPGAVPLVEPMQLLRGLAYLPMLAELLVIPLALGLPWFSLAGVIVYGWLAWQRAILERELGVSPRG